MNETVGGLVPAQIVTVDEKTMKTKEGGHAVKCMFNPYEYTLSKSNSFDEKKAPNTGNSPPAEISKAGAQTLKLSLYFNSYGPKHDGVHPHGLPQSGVTDVSLITDDLWKFMKVTTEGQKDKNDKKHVPLVAFDWGVFFFISYITNMTQKFTLFSPKGIPVRAKVDITFTQYRDEEDRKKQNPTSGSGPVNRVHRVVAGDRLDLIANRVYQDATKWRYIADYNNLANPSALTPGQMLIIPFEQEAING